MSGGRRVLVGCVCGGFGGRVAANCVRCRMAGGSVSCMTLRYLRGVRDVILCGYRHCTTVASTSALQCRRLTSALQLIRDKEKGETTINRPLTHITLATMSSRGSRISRGRPCKPTALSSSRFSVSEAARAWETSDRTLAGTVIDGNPPHSDSCTAQFSAQLTRLDASVGSTSERLNAALDLIANLEMRLDRILALEERVERVEQAVTATATRQVTASATHDHAVTAAEHVPTANDQPGPLLDDSDGE